MSASSLFEAVREHPVAMALELGTLLACVFLLVGTVVLLAGGPPVGRGDPWLVIIGLGVAVVVLWTVVVPLYTRRT